MYTLKLSTTEEEILEFERKRMEVFESGKDIKKTSHSVFSKGIQSGDLLAFRCLKEGKTIGGMLLGLQGKTINIMRLFVDEKQRGKGAGSFMVDYVVNHQEFFEDYYATDIKTVTTEPLYTNMDFYLNKGFGHSGTTMYKKFIKQKKD